MRVFRGNETVDLRGTLLGSGALPFGRKACVLAVSLGVDEQPTTTPEPARALERWPTFINIKKVVCAK